MAYNLILNSNNVLTNHTYRYNFINGFTILDEAEICISQIQIPYSWYNITLAYNNQSFQIKFPTSVSNGATYSITLNEGFYTVTDINAYIQQFCITNGLYLINSLGEYVYYLVLLYNTTNYAIQLITSLVPTSLPTGYTQPLNWVGYNTISYCTQLVIINNNFGKIIGYNLGTYPSINTSSASTLSQNIPIGTNVNSLVIRCSLVDNSIGVPTDLLDVMPINTTFGSNINYQPTALKWIKLTSGVFQYLTIYFTDQDLNSIAIQDTNLTISILINNKGNIPTKIIKPIE
jgi:hypothetical protein